MKPWGQTVSYVLDPNGILVEIGTQSAPDERVVGRPHLPDGWFMGDGRLHE